MVLHGRTSPCNGGGNWSIIVKIELILTTEVIVVLELIVVLVVEQVMIKVVIGVVVSGRCNSCSNCICSQF